MSSKFDEELYKCKAIQLEDDKTIVHGYFDHFQNQSRIGVLQDDNLKSTLVNSYTICRNTGIKIGDEYLYENDLVLYRNGLQPDSLGFIAWDDFRKAYTIRSSLNYSSARDIHGVNISIIGNISLCEEDYKKMQDYSDEQDKGKSDNSRTECRSTQHINKLAKQFLPK
jgi:undecaprenyl pyrophosphate synthase